MRVNFCTTKPLGRHIVMGMMCARTSVWKKREVLQEPINIAFLCLIDVWHIFMFPQQIPLSHFLFRQSSSKRHILTIIPEKLLIKNLLILSLLLTLTQSASIAFPSAVFIWFQLVHVAPLISSNAKELHLQSVCVIYILHSFGTICRRSVIAVVLLDDCLVCVFLMNALIHNSVRGGHCSSALMVLTINDNVIKDLESRNSIIVITVKWPATAFIQYL